MLGSCGRRPMTNTSTASSPTSSAMLPIQSQVGTFMGSSRGGEGRPAQAAVGSPRPVRARLATVVTASVAAMKASEKRMPMCGSGSLPMCST